MSGKKFEFNACDRLSRSAPTRQIQKKNKVDGENKPEFLVDQKLSESHTFALYKDLEG